MTKRSFAKIGAVIFFLYLIPYVTATARQIKLDSTTQEKIAREYVDAFNSGDESRMREFILTNISPDALKDRPVEARIERYKTMRTDMKSLEIQKLISSGEHGVDVLVKTGNSEVLTFGFEFDTSHKLTLMHVTMGEQEPQETGPGMTKQELVSAIENYLSERVRSDKFSGTVLVARDTKILFEHAYGFADKRFNTPNRIETKFNLGSINKFFTRLAIAQLVESGKLSFDDLIIKLLPDYPNKTAAGSVTIKQLLEMTSGLGDFFNAKYEATPKENIRSLHDYLSLFADDTLLFQPGTRRQYSNAGYIVLGLIIEKITGKDYYTYMRENVFKRAGMLNTDSYPMDEITPNLATGYTHPDTDSTKWISNIYTAPGRGSSAGGGYSTIDDLFKFIQALRNGKLLSPKYSQWMVTSDLPATDPALPLKKGDFGIAGGKGRGIVFAHGRVVKSCAEDELVESLIREVEKSSR